MNSAPQWHGFEINERQGHLATHIAWMLRGTVAIDGGLSRAVQLPSNAFDKLGLMEAEFE